MRSLEQWLAYQEQVHPQTIDLGLERLNRLLERLQWRQPAVPVITIAGTNGKGSVSAYCGSILRAAGYRVGSFTSPHLRDYRERIRVHERLATPAELVQAFERIEAARTAAPALSLTFFEYNALAAFLTFEAARLDAWVLEVGMGGRLDAVNVIEPSVAVVVSIALDHEEFLGNTLEAIAREKSGIFRAGKPAVLGTREPPALARMAEATGARPKRLGVEFDYTLERTQWQYRGVRWNLEGLPPPALVGETQFANAATAIAALEELEHLTAVTPRAIAAGLEAARLVGRFQVIPAGAGTPQWVLDVAHNPAAAEVLASNLRHSPWGGKTFAVCGILGDKDAAGIVAALRDCIDAWWFVSTAGPRGTSAALLAERVAGEITAPVARAGDVAAACAAARAAAGPRDRIVVLGSFHTVGPALDWLEAQGLLMPDGSLPAAHPEYTHAPRRQ